MKTLHLYWQHMATHGNTWQHMATHGTYFDLITRFLSCNVIDVDYHVI